MAIGVTVKRDFGHDDEKKSPSGFKGNFKYMCKKRDIAIMMRKNFNQDSRVAFKSIGKAVAAQN